MWLDMSLYKRKKSGGELEEVIYWRKANAIHKWFSENVETNKEDLWNCKISVYKIKELLQKVNEVLEKSVLVKWKVKNGATMTRDWWKDNLEDGKYIKNPNIAESILPTIDWFFFWSTDYDEHYLWKLEHTKEGIEKALKDLWDDEEFIYGASR